MHTLLLGERGECHDLDVAVKSTDPAVDSIPSTGASARS
jgi:hypothetical protein